MVFSHNAIIAPYRDGKAFEFRIANKRKNEIIWNARFEDIFNYAPDHGAISIDVSRIHNVERLEPAP